VQQDVLLPWVGVGLGSSLVPALLLSGSSCCKCSWLFLAGMGAPRETFTASSNTLAEKASTTWTPFNLQLCPQFLV
jgi:hypothetical protein